MTIVDDEHSRIESILDECIMGNIDVLNRNYYERYTITEFTTLINLTKYSKYLQYVKINNGYRLSIYNLLFIIIIVEKQIDLFKIIKPYDQRVYEICDYLDYDIPIDMIDVMQQNFPDKYKFVHHLVENNNLDAINYLIDNNINLVEIYVYACLYANLTILQLLLPFSKEMMEIPVVCGNLSCVKFLIEYGVDFDILIVNAFILINYRYDYSLLTNTTHDTNNMITSPRNEFIVQENNIMKWYIENDYLRQIDHIKINNVLKRIGMFYFRVNLNNMILLLNNIDVDYYVDNYPNIIGRICYFACCGRCVDLLKIILHYASFDDPHMLELLLIDFYDTSNTNSEVGNGVEIMKLLLDSNIDPNGDTHNGRPIDLAVSNRKIEYVKLLLDYNAHISSNTIVRLFHYDMSQCSDIVKLIINSAPTSIIKTDSEIILVDWIEYVWCTDCDNYFNLLIEKGLIIDTSSTKYIETCILCNNTHAINILAQYNINMDFTFDDDFIGSWYISLNMIQTLITYNINLPINNKKFMASISNPEKEDIYQWLVSNNII